MKFTSLIMVMGIVVLNLGFPNDVFANIAISNYTRELIIDESQTVILKGKLEPEAEYYVKVRLGKNIRDLNQAQTYNSDDARWLNDKNIWKAFPVLYTDYEGNIDPTGVEFKAKPDSQLGENMLVIEVRNVTSETEKHQSEPVKVILKPIANPPQEKNKESSHSATSREVDSRHITGHIPEPTTPLPEDSENNNITKSEKKTNITLFLKISENLSYIMLALAIVFIILVSYALLSKIRPRN